MSVGKHYYTTDAIPLTNNEFYYRAPKGFLLLIKRIMVRAIFDRTSGSVCNLMVIWSEKDQLKSFSYLTLNDDRRNEYFYSYVVSIQSTTKTRDFVDSQELSVLVKRFVVRPSTEISNISSLDRIYWIMHFELVPNEGNENDIMENVYREYMDLRSSKPNRKITL